MNRKKESEVRNVGVLNGVMLNGNNFHRLLFCIRGRANPPTYPSVKKKLSGEVSFWLIQFSSDQEGKQFNCEY